MLSGGILRFRNPSLLIAFKEPIKSVWRKLIRAEPVMDAIRGGLQQIVRIFQFFIQIFNSFASLSSEVTALRLFQYLICAIVVADSIITLRAIDDRRWLRSHCTALSYRCNCYQTLP